MTLRGNYHTALSHSINLVFVNPKHPIIKVHLLLKLLGEILIVFLNRSQQGKTGNICQDKSASRWDMKLIAKT